MQDEASLSGTGKAETIDIAAQTEEVRAAMRNDMDTFGMLAMPEDITLEFPPIFKELWSMLTAVMHKARDFSKYAVGLPRGHGKTLVLKLLVLYAICFTQKRFILVICATEPMAKNILADIADLLDSPNIQAIFGNWRMRIEVDRQELKKFYFNGRPVILAAAGVGTSIRGMQLKNARPDLMIFDDAQTRECAKSVAESKAFQTWLLGTALKAKSPTGCTFMYIGNMYPDMEIKPANGTIPAVYACMLRNLQYSKYWTSFIVGAILADGSALWEELQPLVQLLEEFENDKQLGSPETFYAEVLNDPQAGASGALDLAKVRMFVDKREQLHLGNFIIIDPAGEKDRSDDTAMGYFELHQTDHQHLTRVCKRIKREVMDPLRTIETALQWALETGCTLIAVESVAYQASLLFWFARVCEMNNINHINFVELYPGGYSKNRRILRSFREVENGLIWFTEDTYTEYTDQASKFDKMITTNKDDVLDIVAYSEQVMNNYDGLMTMQSAGSYAVESPLHQLNGPDYYQ